MNLRVLGLTFLLAGASIDFARAGALLDFDFCIKGDSSFGNCGTITGEIIGLKSWGCSSPCDVIITSLPRNLGVRMSDFSVDSSCWTVYDDSFTVRCGQITCANFYSIGDDGKYAFAINHDGTNEFENILKNRGVGNLCGLDGVTFTQVKPCSSVPEPSQYAAFVFLAVVGLSVWRRRFASAAMARLSA